METPDALPTPQGGAQTPGYFFARNLPAFGSIGLIGIMGSAISQCPDSSATAHHSDMNLDTAVSLAIQPLLAINSAAPHAFNHL